ncbi:MAG: HEAT repeat domain-containing protein [Planctomycetota bacterium]|nr:HEAT repeat domain-containing protein [Planctomycetota bacterium]
MKIKYMVLPLGLIALGGIFFTPAEPSSRRTPAHVYVDSKKRVEKKIPPVNEILVQGHHEEIERSLHQYLSDSKPIQPGTAAYREQVPRVAAFLQKFPGALDEAGALILSDHVHLYTKWMLLEAIGSYTPSSEAHALLRQLASNPSLGEDVLITLVSVFGLAVDIPEDSIDFLLERSRDPDRLGRVALSTMGRVAGVIRKRDPASASRIVSILSGRLRDQDRLGKSNEVASILEALGNTGDRHLVARIWPFLEHSNSRVRGAALVTLGSLDKNGSEARLRFALQQDPDPRVRMEAIEALMPVPNGVPDEQVANAGRMGEGTLSDLLQVVEHDENERVRLEVMDAFHEIYETPPSRVTETLRTIAQTDSSNHVREMAGWYLKYGYFTSGR